MAAVQRNSLALKHVKEQTQEICTATMQSNRDVFHYVQKRTPAVWVYWIFLNLFRRAPL